MLGISYQMKQLIKLDNYYLAIAKCVFFKNFIPSRTHRLMQMAIIKVLSSLPLNDFTDLLT